MNKFVVFAAIFLGTILAPGFASPGSPQKGFYFFSSADTVWFKWDIGPGGEMSQLLVNSVAVASNETGQGELKVAQTNPFVYSPQISPFPGYKVDGFTAISHVGDTIFIEARFKEAYGE